MEKDLYFPSSQSATWTTTNTSTWTIMWILVLLGGILVFLLFLYLFQTNQSMEEGAGNQALAWEYPELLRMASRGFCGVLDFLQELLDSIVTRKADFPMRMEKEKEEELSPIQCRQECGLNSEKAMDLPDINQDTPGPPPFLSVDDQAEEKYEETIKAVETTVSRSKSGYSPRVSDIENSQFVTELFNTWDTLPDECPTISSQLGEQDVGQPPLKDYPNRKSKLHLEGEPQSQSPPGCAAEGFPDSYSFSSEDSKPQIQNECRGNMATSQGPYIHLEDRGSSLGLQEQRDSTVPTSWMVQDANLNLNTGKEDAENFQLGKYPEGEAELGPSLTIEIMSQSSQDEGSTESLMPQFLPQKGQGHQNKHRKRVSRMLQWICLGRKRNSPQVALETTRSALFSQQQHPSRSPTIVPSEPATPIRAHQHVPRVPGPPGRRRHFPLQCIMACISPTQS